MLLRFLIPAVMCAGGVSAPLYSQTFRFPTANTALLEVDGAERFFTPTIGRTWPSGSFGCVRSEGWRMHEGIDISCLERDKQGEPVDPVMATTDGGVVYINAKAGLSAYGNYVVLRHRVDSLEVYSLYAHLRSIPADLKKGQSVKEGDTIGTLGRTANHPISRKRAHLHFELTLLLNDGYDSWRRQAKPGTRNDHGKFTGLNLVGFDPAEVLVRQSTQAGQGFSLLEYLRNQKMLFRVMVRDTDFPWLRRYVRLVQRNPVAETEGLAGYEIWFNFNGLPFRLIPRAESEMPSKEDVVLLEVDESEYQENRCRQLVEKSGSNWQLTQRGIDLVDLLTF